MTDPHPVLISTIVLNWNRAILLRQTLRSYADTVSGPAEIVVVDNGSMDESLRVIEEARSYLPRLKTVFLDQNIGGEAVNHALTRYRASLSISAKTIWYTFRTGPITSEKRFCSSRILANSRCSAQRVSTITRDGGHGRAAFASRRAKFFTRRSETSAQRLCCARP